MSDCCCIATVSTGEVAVLQSCGKFSRLAEAGCLCIFYPFENIAGKVSLRIQELKCNLETKTLDNVFVTVHVSVQYQAIREKVYSAYYSLQDLQQQMRSYIFDVVRTSLCQMTLDHAFESKEEICSSLKHHLQDVFAGYGFSIINALITDLFPDQRVRDAMNEINSSKRMKEAAYQRAEGEKVVKVKRAEAAAESMYLSGVGVSKERKAIMDGLKASIIEFESKVSGASAKDVMDLLVLNQYFDTLTQVGSQATCKTVMLSNDHNPYRSGIMQANAGF